jgi:hypothetical protein
MAVNSPESLGRAVVVSVLGLVLAITLASTSLTVVPFGRDVIRLLLTIILLVFLYRGHTWARVLTVILLASALAVLVYTYISGYTLSARAWGMAIFYLSAIYVFIWFKPAKEFLRSQSRARRNVA